MKLRNTETHKRKATNTGHSQHQVTDRGDRDDSTT